MRAIALEARLETPRKTRYVPLSELPASALLPKRLATSGDVRHLVTSLSSCLASSHLLSTTPFTFRSVPPCPVRPLIHTFILPQPHKVSPINWLAHPCHILSFRNLTQTSTPTSTVTFSTPPHPILSYPILPILSNATPPFLRFRPSSRWMAVLSPDEFLGIDISQRSANRMCCVVLCCDVMWYNVM